jgi:SET domain
MIQLFDFQAATVLATNLYAVTRRDGAFCLTAAKAIEDGAELFWIKGVETAEPSFASVQVGPGLHIDMEPHLDLTAQMDLYPWRFMNHSCDPNCIIRDQAVFAKRAVEAGDDLTFDYNSTEYDMAAPFACTCGSEACMGLVSGWGNSDAQ